MSDIHEFQSELEAHNLIAGPQNRGFRRKLHQEFKSMFHGEGHAHSLRNLAKALQSRKMRRVARNWRMGQFLEMFHHRAFDVLAQYGIDYIPHFWRGRPKWGEPETARCGQNSLAFAKMHNEKCPELPIVYVEGLAIGPLVRPMLHAWNALGLEGAVAYDWTFYSASKWTRYLGIPLTEAEYWEGFRLVGQKKYLPLLLHKRCFPKVESYLRDLLAARAEAKAA